MKKIATAIDVTSLALTIGALIGVAWAIHSVVSHQYFGNGLHRLIGLSFQRNINTGLLTFGVAVIGLYLVWFLLSKISAGGGKHALRIDTIVVLAFFGGLVVGWLLRVYTAYTLNTAVGQFVARIKDSFSGEIGVGDLLRLIVKHIEVVGVLAGGILLLVLLYWGLGKIDLRRVYFRRWVSLRFVRVGAAVLAVVVIGVNVAMAVDSRVNAPRGPNVIFICIDALRADCLGFYGYDRDTSPFIDSLARENIAFRNVTSQSSWTKTSVASFMTARYDALGTVATQKDKLSSSAVTLAEILQNQRYRTGAIVANPWLTVDFGFDQGFDLYDETAVEKQRIDEQAVIDRLANLTGKPFFLYLHFMGVHNPYEAPAPYFDMFAEGGGEYRYHNGIVSDMAEADLAYTRALYDGEVRFLDQKILHVFDFLEEQGIRDDTVVIIMSDHGDEFLEHGGLGHGTTLYGELLRVPLIVVPGERLQVDNAVIEVPVRNLDIVPTLLDILDVPIPGGVQGTSLVNLMAGAASERVPDFTLSGVVSIETAENLVCLAEDGYKYIRNRTNNADELYDLTNDPADTYNLADSLPDVCDALGKKLSAYTAALIPAGPNGETVRIDKKTMEKLKSLGYL